MVDVLVFPGLRPSELGDTLRKDKIMIIVRNVFRLKFGKAREAVAALKEGVAIQRRIVTGGNIRLLTDLTGPFYTLVLELTMPSLSELEATMPKVMGDKDFQAAYQRFTPLVESGFREILNIVE